MLGSRFLYINVALLFAGLTGLLSCGGSRPAPTSGASVHCAGVADQSALGLHRRRSRCGHTGRSLPHSAMGSCAHPSIVPLWQASS